MALCSTILSYCASSTHFICPQHIQHYKIHLHNKIYFHAIVPSTLRFLKWSPFAKFPKLNFVRILCSSLEYNMYASLIHFDLLIPDEACHYAVVSYFILLRFKYSPGHFIPRRSQKTEQITDDENVLQTPVTESIRNFISCQSDLSEHCHREGGRGMTGGCCLCNGGVGTHGELPSVASRRLDILVKISL
jgi:hypothetical protein